MPDRAKELLRHLIVKGFTEKSGYTRPQRKGPDTHIPPQDRAFHGDYLLGQLASISRDMLSAIQIQEKAGIKLDRGITIEFESFPAIGEAFDDLTFGKSGIELLNVRHAAGRTYASVFVPDGKLAYFVKKIDLYRQHKTDKNGKPGDNQKLIDTIENITLASINALWTDAVEAFPTETEPAFWWEAWLPTRGNRDRTIKGFKELASYSGLRTSASTISFPERSVLLIQADLTQMKGALPVLSVIAELRRAKDTADFFVELPAHEERPWVDLARRTSYAESSDETPRICVVDTGINRGHPLLAGSIDAADLFSINPSWGKEDHDGHGTSIAGLSLYGDLTEPLSNTEPVLLSHRLESSKLLPKDDSNTGDEHLHADLMMQAVYGPEISYPHRKRVFELAVSAKDYRDRGRPSAWSAVLDQLASRSGDDDSVDDERRLFIVAAGNVDSIDAWKRYPQSNDEEGIHDPGQSWNALTVGACTDKVTIAGDRSSEYTAMAPAGDISPFSTTSSTWKDQWPLKPDVVMEGGNVGQDSFGPISLDSLGLLSINYKPSDRLLTTVNATSAASALAARMAAQIMAQYPELRPETIRGIIVHTARWTDAMKSRYGINDGSNKGDYSNLIRHCGFGVPSLQNALWSLTNSVTMVVEDSLTPFSRSQGSSPRMNEARYHALPWPKEILSSLGPADAEMRVTLSYYIEPNPSSRGRSKYSYESHGLRFDVQQPTETFDHFKGRVNSQSRKDGQTYTSDSESQESWIVGKNNRHRGSIHSDIWRGSAVELATCNAIAVYPTGGWWQKRQVLGKYESEARYSLIVTIETPKNDIDLYTPIETLVKTVVPISISQQ